MLQIEPFGNDQSRNLTKGLESCREAKALGADLVVFPELWNIGFTADVCPYYILSELQLRISRANYFQSLLCSCGFLYE